MKVVSHNYLNPEDVDKAMPLLKQLVKNSRTEDGCQGYALYVDKRDPAHVVFIEDWRDKDALNAHGESEAFTDVVGELFPYMAKDPSIVRLNEVEID